MCDLWLLPTIQHKHQFVFLSWSVCTHCTQRHGWCIALCSWSMSIKQCSSQFLWLFQKDWCNYHSIYSNAVEHFLCADLEKEQSFAAFILFVRSVGKRQSFCINFNLWPNANDFCCSKCHSIFQLTSTENAETKYCNKQSKTPINFH